MPLVKKFIALLEQYQKAVERLREILAEPPGEIVRDSAIKRFEFTYELAWKTIKAYLERQGVDCASPRDCFQEAYRQGLIDYNDIWLEMIDLRNKTASFRYNSCE